MSAAARKFAGVREAGSTLSALLFDGGQSMFDKAAGILLLAAAVFPIASVSANAQSASDACSLLTQAQVSAAVGAQVGAGVWVTPSFKATCTWTAPGKIVTLMTEGLDAYQAGKKPLNPAMTIVPASGVGDEAYYVVTGSVVALMTRKASVAFKTSVYSKLPLDTLESMESALAKQAASQL
jgi:hypothetical protein